MIYKLIEGNDISANLSLAQALIFAAVMFSFAATRIATHFLHHRLPKDGGRDFAVDGKKSAGKGRGAGIIFVSVFVISTIIFIPINMELVCYMVIMMLTMLSGFLDDAAATPWGEYKKGIIDFVIALSTAIIYGQFNGTSFTIAIINRSFTLPSWLFIILAVILIWSAINTVNCCDGVDGLSASLVISSLIAFYMFFDDFRSTTTNVISSEQISSILSGSIFDGLTEDGLMTVITDTFLCKGLILSFIFCLLAYLLFNANPSILMMGDAGSRAMGMFLAIIALKSRSPFLFIPFCLVIILDGGLGLIKIVCIRFLKLKNFMKNIRTPLHDHVRKNIEPAWSPTHVVFRFVIVQAFICALYLGLIYIFSA